MEALRASSFPSFHPPPISTKLPRTISEKPNFHIPSIQQITTPLSKIRSKKANFKVFTAISPTAAPSSTEEESSSPDQEIDSENNEEKFDWYANWYPVVPMCDLDKRRPHGKKVMGMDIVIWWDRNEDAWKVFDDSCPHRLAPLSEGRIDQWGRLQCVYHGWCFGGAGDCKLIPQAPRDGPPIHTSKKACVAVYPTCVQNGILWFWPNSDPQYKDILSKKKPHYIPELDDPTYTNSMIARDIPYGYEILIENLMDPAHVPYAHYGIMSAGKTPESLKADREGGRPLEINIQKVDINGFTAKQVFGDNYFIPPCLYYGFFSPGGAQTVKKTSSSGTKDEVVSPIPPQKRALLIFYCVPVSPGNSRLIFVSPRNFAVWIERIFPRWIFHIGQNLILDSDLYLLHVEERKLMEVGSINWQKSCFVPTKADALVVAFRKWLNKYGGTKVDWGTKFTGLLPPTPHREQLFDRYWSHTVNCSSCSVAHKRLNVLEIALQVFSVFAIGIVAAAKQGVISVAARYALFSAAVLCFVASKWLSHFIYKTFRYHDYDHAFR
ncbi:PREDICTED: protochlorophyllide-dependent translocon component 52, chloroplastic-like [Erythranthe guttata]|uniref:protochlorophyllide-dependent translocon component 52, chloroplastic-like n=1 Tax=Erythranthe guttata TaxID=4155 RepID=UPI00064DAE91|nr:PREDICTED: protochlorophyllide-dependent translocon component 52, chloroplastic-like [Erythranthe guttata]|eukprot:XP_012835283.1 PREDICTED: protochlorophyllide-dependent translocon component 52, chloroplastic-like [Erythranthe guttata]